jgi:hypothetical protein
MKEYKLSGWPELQAPYHRTRYRRMLSDMSHRYVSFSQLVSASNATRVEVKMFLEMLGERGVLQERQGEADSIKDSFWSVASWFRRTRTADFTEH